MESHLRFSDGGRYRIEIPSVEGPEAFRAVLDEAERRRIRVRRVSQGSGVMMLTDEEMRELVAAVSVPLDVYVEVPDDQGGFVRFYEVPDLVRAAAPVYIKLGVRNAPAIYPSGLRLVETAIKLGRERVRRAELWLRLLAEQAPELVEDAGDERPADLGIPEVVHATA
jgi:hypothetical protein